MKTIHKYSFQPSVEFFLRLPKGAEVLCVQVQRDQPCIWALVDLDAELLPTLFSVRGAGHDGGGLTADQYVGTFQLNDGELVLHLFKGGA